MEAGQVGLTEEPEPEQARAAGPAPRGAEEGQLTPMAEEQEDRSEEEW